MLFCYCCCECICEYISYFICRTHSRRLFSPVQSTVKFIQYACLVWNIDILALSMCECVLDWHCVCVFVCMICHYSKSECRIITLHCAPHIHETHNTHYPCVCLSRTLVPIGKYIQCPRNEIAISNKIQMDFCCSTLAMIQ